MWNKQTFSIATDELSALTSNEFTTVMGALIIDLVSAPITPGIYNIHLTAMMGGIRIFLPAYAKVQLDGKPFWGDKRVYRPEQFWEEMRSAFANSDVQVPTLSGAGVYQLAPNSVESKHANQANN
jgi:predicted membrane protein